MFAGAKVKQAGRAANLSGSFCCALVLLVLAAGCATPIGVQYVDPRTGYQSLTANILSSERPSSFSAR